MDGGRETPPNGWRMNPRIPRWVLGWLACAASLWAAAPAPTVLVGTAKVDITPELPIRLSGYGNRTAETTRAETRLFARALALGADDQQPAVLITLELIGVGAETSEFVTAALRAKHGIARERVALCATHIHTDPALADLLPFMFSQELPAEQAAHIASYTTALREKLVALAGAALADRRPGRLAWAEGTADFAAQRRVVVDGKWKTFGVVPAGPVDHALPVLRVTDAQGALRAVFVSYACHCTTRAGGDNYVHSEWAGDAARRLEAEHAGAVALVALGCGADANPNPRGAEAVAAHGATIATEVERLLAGAMRPLGAVTQAQLENIELPLDHVVGTDELKARLASKQKTVSYAAQKFLERGAEASRGVTYPVQAWIFGRQLAMVFLGGEVVSEYSLRLRRELDGARLWVNAYANSVPCYIPSRRMFAEGGYEVDTSMDYYGFPTRLAVGTEDRIVAAVRATVPAEFQRKGQP